MSYADIENSVQHGEPVATVTLRVEGQEIARWQNNIDQVLFSKIKSSGSLDDTGIDITIPSNDSLVALFRSALQPGTITCEIRLSHIPLLGTFEPDWVVHRGTVLQHKEEETTLTFTSDTVLRSVTRPGLRMNYQNLCPHSLGQGHCRALVYQFGYETVSVSSNTFTIDAGWMSDPDANPGQQPVLDRYPNATESDFVLGFVDIYDSAPSGTQKLLGRRMITSVENGVFTVSYPIPPETAYVTIRPGCNKTREVCHRMFSAMDYHGGVPWTPRQNPAGPNWFLE